MTFDQKIAWLRKHTACEISNYKKRKGYVWITVSPSKEQYPSGQTFGQDNIDEAIEYAEKNYNIIVPGRQFNLFENEKKQ